MENKPISNEWLVELTGEYFDLQELTRLNTLNGVSVEKEDGRYYLRAGELSSFVEPRKVLARAKEIVGVLNGIAHIAVENWQRVEAGGVARDEPHGGRSQFLLPDTIRGRTRFGVVNVTITRADGSVDISPQHHPVKNLFDLAQTDAAVETASRIYGSREHSWENLYKILEVISGDVGGIHKIVENGWSSKAKIKNFKHTADSVGAIGDNSRHGTERTSPPTAPMSLPDAQSMVENLLRDWLKSKT